MKWLRSALGFLVASAALTGVALAEPAVDFGIIAPSVGSITYAGGSGPLVGTGISVDNVVGINGTPLNNGVTATCIACFMDFSTGNLSSRTDFGSFVLYSFFGGGSLSINGTVDFGSGNTVTGTLLSGVFHSATPTLIQIAVSGSGFNVFGPSTFSATLNSGIASFYGLQGQPTYTGLANLSFFTASGPNGSFYSTSIGSGDVIASTPEPVSIILLGTTLVLCGTIWRRRLTRSIE